MTKIDPLRSLRPVTEEVLEELVDRATVPSGKPLAYDVYASNHELVIEFDVPGVTAEEMQVEVDDRTLVVTATREPRTGRAVDVIETGRQHGTFTRRLFLGERSDLARLTATLKHGGPSITSPMTAETNRRRIDIRVSTLVPVETDASVDTAA